MSEDLKKVTIYTDGAAEPNPGPGGYGVVMIHEGHRKEFHGAFRRTTNNRMELYAALHGLEKVKYPCDITVYSDSKYLVDAMVEGWVTRWRAKGWRRGKREKVVNVDLWIKLLAQCDKHRVAFQWVKGHAGHQENERCDALSIQLLRQADLPEDEGYERGPDPALYQAPPSLYPAESAPPDATKPRPSQKMTEEGQPCRKCSTPIVKRASKTKLPNPGQKYYYDFYLFCPGCKTTYMVEEARQLVTPGPAQ